MLCDKKSFEERFEQNQTYYIERSVDCTSIFYFSGAM